MGFFARIDQMSFQAKTVGTVLCLMIGLITSAPVISNLGKNRRPTRTVSYGTGYGYGGGTDYGRRSDVPPPAPSAPARSANSLASKLLPAKRISQSNFVYDLSTTPAGELKLLETTGAQTIQLKSSLNDGRNWGLVGDEINLAAMENDANRGIWNRIQFTDEENGWAYGNHTGLWRTKDGGASWIEVELPEKLLYPEMAWASQDVGYLAGNVEGDYHQSSSAVALLKTTNGGRSWRFVSTFSSTMGSIVQLLAPTETDLLIVLQADSVRRSSNGGASWSIVTANADTKRVFCDKSGWGWLLGEKGNFRRFRNFGNVLGSQEEMPVGLQDANWLSIDVSPQTGFGIAGGSLGAMAVTYDSGATWRAVRLDSLAPNSSIDRVIVRGNKAYIFSSGKVYQV